MRRIRGALLSPTLVRRMVVSLLAAVAVIVGLLAMHTFNLHDDDTGVVVASSVAHQNAPADDAATVLADCSGSCHGDMPMHDTMTMTMACFLALLVLVLVVGLPLTLRFTPPPGGRDATSALMRTAIEPRPPSLSILSISRT